MRSFSLNIHAQYIFVRRKYSDHVEKIAYSNYFFSHQSDYFVRLFINFLAHILSLTRVCFRLMIPLYIWMNICLRGIQKIEGHRSQGLMTMYRLLTPLIVTGLEALNLKLSLSLQVQKQSLNFYKQKINFFPPLATIKS